MVPPPLRIIHFGFLASLRPFRFITPFPHPPSLRQHHHHQRLFRLVVLKVVLRFLHSFSTTLYNNVAARKQNGW
jgi:hypothetical protein